MASKNNMLQTQTVWLALADTLCLMVAIVTGVSLRAAMGRAGLFGLEPLIDPVANYLFGHVSGWIYFCGSMIIANYVVGSYGVQVTTSRFNLLVNWIFALIVSLLVLGITSYAWFEQLLGRGVLLTSVCMYALLSLLVKVIFYGTMLRDEPFICRVLVLGKGALACEARKVLESRNVLPAHRVCAFAVCDDVRSGGAAGAEGLIDGVAVMRVVPDAVPDLVRSMGVGLVVQASESRDRPGHCDAVLRRIRFGGVEVMDALSVAEHYSGRIPLALVNNVWLTQASLTPSLAVVGRFKRILDLLVVILGAPLAIPASLVVGLLVKLSSPRRHAFFTQQRVGQFGKLFRIYKFRTMRETRGLQAAAAWSPEHDPRVTRLGSVLRKFRLDEIPQLWNVFLGDMSLVGPRPEQPELAAKLEAMIPFYRERENVPPGLSGWAQVQYAYTDNIEGAATKLEYDLYYVKNVSLRLDIQIILRTLRIILFGMERKGRKTE